MSCSITSVFTFKIESTFDEWAAIFDSAEAEKRHSEFLIKPLFRGVSKEDPQKVIVIHQAPEGNVQKFVEAYELPSSHHWLPQTFEHYLLELDE